MEGSELNIEGMGQMATVLVCMSVTQVNGTLLVRVTPNLFIDPFPHTHTLGTHLKSPKQ